MVNRNINNGKLKISKKLIALMLAGTCTFSLAGCKNNSESRVKKNSDRESRVMIGAVEKDGDNTQFVRGTTVEIKDEHNNVVDKWVSTDCYHLIKNLDEGDYTASLVILPEGYVNNFETIAFEKNSDDEDITIDFELEREPIIEENINESSSNYLSIKYLFNDDSIEFAENMYAQIGLFDLDNRLIECWVSRNSEIRALKNLEPGTYIVKVIFGPDGYKPMDNDKMINITGNEEIIDISFSFEEKSKELTNNSHSYMPTKKIKNR